MTDDPTAAEASSGHDRSVAFPFTGDVHEGEKVGNEVEGSRGPVPAIPNSGPILPMYADTNGSDSTAVTPAPPKSRGEGKSGGQKFDPRSFVRKLWPGARHEPDKNEPVPGQPTTRATFVRQEGESGRQGFHPLHFLRIMWSGSSYVSVFCLFLWPFVPVAIVLQRKFRSEIQPRRIARGSERKPESKTRKQTG